MTKIGTVHIEVKPVLNREALDAIVEQIQQAVEQAVDQTLMAREQAAYPQRWVHLSAKDSHQAWDDAGINAVDRAQLLLGQAD